ncbi:FecCD family ABC transporter permease [Intestinimonas timonensis]|mgnify:FL=1|uniref:FecCD family ABC transporter permease n=1 Tax=Intestinimonas timonensis TaxID=1689270 RepID=UPI0023F03243|nr:iron ABC transporter permease [Intestinimonas timonensis]
MERNRFGANSAYLLVCLGLLGALLLSLLAAVSFGTVSIPLGQVYEVILEELRALLPGGTAPTGSSVHDVVWLIRLPRLILAVGVGMGLSVCGAVMQAIVKNPLADPYVLGVSSGAYLGASLAMLLGFGGLLGGSAMGMLGCAGALLVSLGVMALANLGGRSNAVKLLLAGTALSAVCSGFSNFFIFLLNDDHAASAVVQWSMGSLAAADWGSNAVIVAVAVSGTLFFWSQYRNLNLMLLGDDCAVTLGTDLHRWRLIYLTVAAVMVGFAVYKAGLIGFVGLLIPHVVRMLFGTDHKKLIPISALLGAIFLVWADVLCRVILPGNELPIGVLTALVGAPVFVYLMARKKYGFGGGD